MSKDYKVVYTDPPKKCDTCTAPIMTEFVDGMIKGGPWANMCPACFSEYGVGLGTGKGQRYVKDDAGQFIKVEG